MGRSSSFGLLTAAAAMTVALAGLFADWERLRWIAPFGDPRLTPIIFVPLLVVACYGIVGWFTARFSASRVALLVGAIACLSMCIVVVTVTPIRESSKLIVSAVIVAFVASLCLLRASYAGRTGND